MRFRVAVIIPVYNAAAFVKQAISSVLVQPEVEEVILINDGSSDSSLEIIQARAALDSRLRVLQYPDGLNRGAGAARNLGIAHSTAPYLAFLDADDYYLPNRFVKARELLENNLDLDGVYEAVDTGFQDTDTEHRWHRYWRGRKLTMLTKLVEPAQLFEALVLGGHGYFHLNGLTLRREAVTRAGLFSETLRLHQDTDFCIRLAATTQLRAGSWRPIAVRRFHAQSRILAAREQPDDKSIFTLYEQLLAWGQSHLNAKQRAQLQIAAKLAHLRACVKRANWPGRIWHLVSALSSDLSLLKQVAYWKLYLRP